MKRDVRQKATVNYAAEEEQLETFKDTWHAPRLERLRLSLDTASTAGSTDDGVGRPTIF